MTDEQMEHLVTRIIQRLQPPVLVMVTAAAGYRQTIRQRLSVCGQTLHFILDDDITDSAEWQSLGKVLPAGLWRETLPPEPYRALLLPFLDYPLAAALINGTLSSPIARRLHETLLNGTPVLALRYHCDPDSELNQLRGAAADSAYAGHMRATLARLAECGVTLCSMNELLEQLISRQEAPAGASGPRRYLTVTDIVNNPTLATIPGSLLTDAASDFVKNRKI
ncbi:hypothetical protein FEM41_20700 [Jejubacter calystegiae]|uniref:Flavoprotein n=1 Tax=Jejubacter calystegiae TaxID=2579935 RepID=A0A4P8YSV9_9ENTR|nr:hypothetical protein [Jejubacter calystegiae]QCT21902.1 hypothetical protein FEM41_20700 [Jejubacter calystegiae]